MEVITAQRETRQDPHAHLVRFYDRDDELLDEVTEFLDAALRADGVAIAIATGPHRSELRRRLSGFGVVHAGSGPWSVGQVVLLDAEQTLSQFMVGDQPDAARFKATIGPILEQAPPGKPLHAFGEMVAVLCQRGNYAGALALEALWNELLRVHSFSLFCGYPWSLFGSTAHGQAFQHVCRAHTRIVEAIDAGQGHSTAQLQQQLRALQGEVELRERSIQTLRTRERELVEFLENAVEGIHKVKADGTILYANRAELVMLGYSWDEYVGRHIADFHVDKALIRNILDRLASGQVLNDEPALLRCKDGSHKPVLICSNGCFENGEFRYTRCFTRDASDRMAREKALQQRNSVVMQAPIGAVLLSGEELRFELANDAYCRMVGRSDIAGKTFRDVFPKLADSEAERLLLQSMRSGQPASRSDYRIRVDHGGAAQERFLQFNVQPVAGAADLTPMLMIVAVDVSDHVRARQELERSGAERERLLESVREANRAKDDFLAMLGHELRNPLASIVNALQLMRLRGGSDTSREQGIIQRQVDHLVRMIDDLLDVSRITRRNVVLKREVVDLSQVIANAVEQVSVLIEQRQHRLHLDVERGLYCDCDPARIAQVVANLLANAVRYTPAGGEIALTSALDLQADQIVVRVKDNGCGMSPEVLPHVYELFFQGPREIDRAQGGLGIGLAVVRSLVQAHGGSIEAFSEGAGQGSEFIVRLPAAGRRDDAPASACAGRSDRAPVAKHVVLVDDNRDAVDTMGDLLRARGHAVDVFHDPVDALRSIVDKPPDIAVLDIGLPGMNGHDLGTKIRAACGAACRLIALTGYGQVSDSERSRAAGFDAHLIKPVEIDQLVRLIEAPENAAAADVAC
ncbi:ATP-binding protein [Roseateles sp.]|uniref:ATP-binding protein n=1 Tax=Roseateles sp. TaxID=1971397 RepID=UPI0031D20F40